MIEMSYNYLSFSWYFYSNMEGAWRACTRNILCSYKCKCSRIDGQVLKILSTPSIVHSATSSAPAELFVRSSLIKLVLNYLYRFNQRLRQLLASAQMGTAASNLG